MATQGPGRRLRRTSRPRRVATRDEKFNITATCQLFLTQVLSRVRIAVMAREVKEQALMGREERVVEEKSIASLVERRQAKVERRAAEAERRADEEERSKGLREIPRRLILLRSPRHRRPFRLQVYQEMQLLLLPIHLLHPALPLQSSMTP